MPNERPANVPQQTASPPATASGRTAGDQDGASAVKYALIASGLGAAVAATVYSLGASGAGLYENIASLF